jgi:adenosylcobinamide-GDP ribazoletransferase
MVKGKEEGEYGLLMRQVRSLLIALQFLTLLPVELRPAPQAREYGFSLLYYPLVGLILGLVLVGCGWLCNRLPDPVVAAIILMLWVGLTGGLHLDGLADSADAWLGGYGDRERTLAIMHDPCSGPIAVVVLVIVLLLKYSALQSLVSQGATDLLLVIPLLGRTALVVLFLTTPYVRPRGLGSKLVQEMARGMSLVVVLLTIIFVAGWLGRTGIVLLLISVLSFWFFRRLMLRRIGGATGDTAGALLEITETQALLVLVGLTGQQAA